MRISTSCWTVADRARRAKRRDLDLMVAAIPFSKDATLRVLDLCCGPGDVGRSRSRAFILSHRSIASIATSS